MVLLVKLMVYNDISVMFLLGFYFFPCKGPYIQLVIA